LSFRPVFLLVKHARLDSPPGAGERGYGRSGSPESEAGQGRRPHEPKTSSATAAARIASLLLPVLSAAIIVCAAAALVVAGLNGPARLEALRALGARIALDDLGTGYSSLSYPRKFPFDRLKIDRAFVTSLGTSGNSGAIIQSIVTLGHALGMKVLGEGVETDEQRVLCGSPAATSCRAICSRCPRRPRRSTARGPGWRARRKVPAVASAR
jgi:predicted signal transduction protein with EAL and GGDEF domain